MPWPSLLGRDDPKGSGLYFINHVKLVNWRLKFAVKLDGWRESCASSSKDLVTTLSTVATIAQMCSRTRERPKPLRLAFGRRAKKQGGGCMPTLSCETI